MNARFFNSPIRSKLRFIILSTCIVSLLVACGVLFAVQFYFFRKNFIQEMASTAQVIAAQSMGAVDFEGRRAGEEILGTLKAKSGLISAQLFLRTGNGLAEIGKMGTDLSTRKRSPVPTRWWEGSDLFFEEPIIRDQEYIGALYLRAGYGQQARNLASLYLAIFCMVLAISVLVAWVISIRMGRLISVPIQKLAETARAIASSDNYDLRAEKLANDEVGAFTETFNFMLDQVQLRDTALRHEIDERQRAEHELQQAQTQLLEASHQAGMAEVATGVLHNVGNVLNSVNVSAALISQKLGGDRLEKLQKTATMMVEQNGNLANFITSDPKGRLIPAYLTNLGSHLLSERKDALAELESLARNIEHIKEIVAVQQSHARVFGVVERIRPEVLVNDAIRMVSVSLRRHQIDLICAVETSSYLEVDRHKVLQILVNLLRNAKHAMEGSESDIRRISVRVSEDETGAVLMTVSDSGCGIPAENLTRIFSHGFTTRKDGHGFGLHSSALAAQQMGGVLTVNSDGPGHGASFALKLPSAMRGA